MKVTLPNGAGSCTNFDVEILNADGSVAWRGNGLDLVQMIAIEALTLNPMLYQLVVRATGAAPLSLAHA